MIMRDDGKKNISDILNGRRMLEIPYYQRSYVWDSDQWERFAKDMQEISDPSAGPYFMGAIILKLKDGGISAGNAELRVLVDGQQRMTTLFVYMKVLSLLKVRPKIFDNQFKLAVHDGDDPTILAMRHNHIDRDAFNRIMNLTVLEDLAIVEKNNIRVIDKNAHRLLRLYEYFRENIDVDLVDSDNIKNNMRFVTITVEEREDEQQIFDAINSLGVKLTTAELLKNYFFNQNNEADFDRYWKPVFEDAEERKRYWDAEIVSGGSRNQLSNLFFSAFLNIKIHDPKYKLTAEEKIKYSKVERLFTSYKDFVDRFYADGKLAFVAEVVSAAAVFYEHFKPEAVNEALTEKRGFARLNLMMFGMDFTTVIPYVLNVWQKVEDDIERDKIFDIIENYLMRRLVCRSETRGYYQLFSDTLLNDAYLSSKGLMGYIDSKDGEEKSESPSNDAIEDAVKLRQRTNKQNASILYMLESRLRSEENATVLMGFKKYSLEHLMPRKWREKWKPLPTEEMGKERDRILQTLGNMAIIPDGLNTSISNSCWQEKLAGRAGKKGLRVCASGLTTMDEWLKLSKWDEGEIAKRAAQLTAWINEQWPASINVEYRRFA